MRWFLFLALIACTAPTTADAPDAAAPDTPDAGIPDGCSVTPTLETYLSPTPLPSGQGDTRCTLDGAGHCTALALQGYLYVPPRGDGPFPILIDNHGSEPMPGQKCIEASYFAQRGYLVFVPHRRGHGQSTGVTLADYVTTYCSTPGADGPCKMEYLHKQVEDVAAAISFVEARPDADRSRLAIMGHSFGGIVSLFSNERNLGQKAVVDVAGGSQSWNGNAAAVAELTTAAETAVAPVLYFEPMNDHSIRPTSDLPAAAATACRQYESALLPAIDATDDGAITAADYAEGGARDTAHGQTMKHTELWGSMAAEFIARYFATPAAPFDDLCVGTSYQ